MLPAIRNERSSLTPTAGSPVNRLSTLFDRLFQNDPFFGPLMTAPA
jgi:hypothetical protein